jgi:TonB-linked SusC/RagA family outer membrane protein
MRKLFLLFAGILACYYYSFAQSNTFSGKITDPNGAPLFNATVKIKGTNIGTVTNADGTFSLKSNSAKVTLEISSIGYGMKTISATADQPVAVSLELDSKSLSEVVVTGVGVATSKKKLGISVESISGDKLPRTPTATIDQALVGKIPGAQISSVSGNPGDQVNIVLRGINTVQKGTRPLVMLDGVEVPYEDLGTLDLGQVERIEVVQGAASATIYGAQGANGVIQIFTKKGSKGHLSINVSTSYAQNNFINAGDFGKASLHPYLTDANGNIINAGSGTGYVAGQPVTIDPVTGAILGSNSIAYKYGSNVPGLTDPIPGLTQNYTRYGILDPRNNYNQPYKGNLHYYDHFAQVFTGASSINNSISVSGGSEKSDFNFAFSNNHTNSPFLKDNGYMDRTNVTVNLGFEVFKNFTFRSISSLVYSYNNMHPQLGAPGGPGYGQGTSNADVGGVYGFLNTSPFFSLTDTIVGGHYASYQRASFLSVNAFNPYYRLEYNSGISKRYDIIENLEANYKVNRFLMLDAKYGISYKNENDVWTYYNQSQNANTEYFSNWTGYYTGTIDENGEIDNWQYNNTRQNLLANATVHLDFDRDLNVHIPVQSTTLIGYDYRKNEYKELDTWGQFLQLAPPFILTATQSQHVASDYVEPFVTYGYLFDQRFDIGNFAGVTGGFRTDYSSAFGAGSKPFTFPHANAFVNLQSLKFWSPLESRIPLFKLRAAYGQAGIQPRAFDRYPVLILQPMGNENTYTNQTAARNPDLGVEVSTEKELGTDMSIKMGGGDWLHSLNLSFTYWKRHTDNAIFDVPVAPSIGAVTFKTNAIALSSNGWQASINIPVLTTANITWDFTVNLGHQTSVIDAVQGGDIPLTTAAGSTGLVLAPGRKIGEIYGYKALTSITQLRADGKTPFIPAASQGDYEIVNGRVVNKITKAIFFSDEASSLGDPNPTLTSSFLSSVTWKNTISFGIQFDWIQGSHLYNQTNEWMYRDGISKDFATPVTINGQTGAWGAYYASAYYALGNTAKGVGNNVTKDYFYRDASFVRLRNIYVGVDFAQFAKKEWLKRCQLVLSGRNLLTFTKYNGMDPEISSGASNSAFDRGIDHSTIPNMKSYQATLNLAF